MGLTAGAKQCHGVNGIELATLEWVDWLCVAF